MKDLFGQDIPDPEPVPSSPEEARRLRRRQYDTPRGYAAPPGTGPEGETCRTCRHATSHKPGKNRFWKCKLVKPTHGPATDIRLKSPACARWEAKEKGQE